MEKGRGREGGRPGGGKANFTALGLKLTHQFLTIKKKKNTKTVRQEKAPQTTSFGIQISVKSNLEKCGETTAKR